MEESHSVSGLGHYKIPKYWNPGISLGQRELLLHNFCARHCDPHDYDYRVQCSYMEEAAPIKPAMFHWSPEH
jgi:hypothetical protein